MTKEEVQQRVLYNGKPLDLDKFDWCDETRTFSSSQNGLVIDFTSISHCTFKTGNNCIFKTGPECTFKAGFDCIFKTGSRCTFSTSSGCVFKAGYRCTISTGSDCIFKAGSRCTINTGSYCTFDTGYNCTFDTGTACTFNTGAECTFDTGCDCTFDTGSNCTFNTGSDCVIVRKGVFGVTQPKENQIIQLCPYKIEGYLTDGYLNGDKTMGKHIIADGILSKVLSKKGNVYKVINHNEEKHSFLIEHNGVYSHGKTVKEARESLVYKISNRDTSMYKDYTLETKMTKDEAIVMYMTITGACAYGTKQFVDSIENIPSELTVKEVIDLTKGKYGNEDLIRFIK